MKDQRLKPLQDKIPISQIEYDEDIDRPPAASIDIPVILAAALRRWKLITATTLFVLVATYGVLTLVPARYKSTVEILVYDPQRQIDAAVQKPLSPFVDALGYDAMKTEINVLKSKSVALRVARELGLDSDPEFLNSDPEFEVHSRLADWAKWFEFAGLGLTHDDNTHAIGGAEEQKAKRLDKAADQLREGLQVYSDAYVISVSVEARNPIKAQLLASTVANDYLVSQREARQQALQRLATWLKGRVDDLQSQLSETVSSTEKLRAQIGTHANGSDNINERQIVELDTQLARARAEVEERRARLEQARHLISTNGDIQNIQGATSKLQDLLNIPELTGSTEISELRQKQVQLSWRIANLQKNLGDRHAEVLAARMQLAGVNEQLRAAAAHILENLQNAYDIAVRRERGIDAELTRVTTIVNSKDYIKLQQLQRIAESTRNLHDDYLSQYNEISQRRTLQDASARIISPATLPKSASSPRRKLFYGLGGVLGLSSGFLLAFLLEYLWSGVRTGTEIERSINRPVLGVIPSVKRRQFNGVFYNQAVRRKDDEIRPQFMGAIRTIMGAIRTMRINLAILNGNPNVILITSALPGEGKSTVAMLMSASSASAGKRTVLLDCDFNHQTVSNTLQDVSRPGLSEVLRGTAKLTDIIVKEPEEGKSYLISAGARVSNGADLLMSQRMRDLVSELREQFDCIVMDTSPLLLSVDALAAATVADTILMVIEWDRTPRAAILEAIKVLGPEAQRVAGVVLNQVDLRQLRGYGYREGYHYCSAGKYFSGA